jgi:hypothetical protein
MIRRVKSAAGVDQTWQAVVDVRGFGPDGTIFRV